MDHIKYTLSRRIKQSGIANQISNALIIEEFQKLIKKDLGESAMKKIKPLYIRNKILTVACLSSVIAQEINFHKQQLIVEINEKIGPNSIQDIRFII